MKYLIVPIFVIGLFIGYWVGYFSYPEPVWDIGQDQRGCVIKWDDGTTSWKTPKMTIGHIGPGQSVTIRPFEIVAEEPPKP